MRRQLLEQLEKRELLAADPGTNPVVLVPGLFGSFADVQNPDGSLIDQPLRSQRVDEWFLNRGMPPEKLALEPYGQVYQNIVKTLENVGYVKDQTLFISAWDWRLPFAPADADSVTNPDGALEVTADELLDPVFESGVDYLAHSIKRAADANPDATHVDIISHSTGGLITRAYLQSAAYGDSRLLPVDNFVMAGVPNEGATTPWNLLNNDWSGALTSREGAVVMNEAYKRFKDPVTGAITPINGPDPAATDDDITDPDITQIEFARRYVELMEDLLVVYPAIDLDGDGELDVIDATTTPLEGVFNDRLLDLNGGADPNGYLELAGTTSIVYSTELPTDDFINEQIGPHPRGFLIDEVLPFTNFIGRSPGPNDRWYLDIQSDHGGDGTVSTFSSVDPFLKDPRVGTTLKLLNITKAASGADEGIDHSGLIFNAYSQGLILDQIGVTGHTPADIESGLALSTLETAGRILQLGILNPVDAFSEIAERFKELLDEARERGSLAANIAYVGEQLGAYFEVEKLWQEKVVDPLAAAAGETFEDALAALGANATDVSSGDDKAIRLSFDVSDLTGGAPNTTTTLNLGSDFPLAGHAEFTFTGDLTFGVTIGYDQSQGFDLADGLFIRDLDLVLGGAASAQNLNLGVSIGSVTAGIDGGSFDLDASTRVSLIDPDGSGRITFTEVSQGFSDFDSLVSITPGGSLDVNFPLNLTDSSTDFELANFGQPILRVASDQMFDALPDAVVDVEINPALQDQILSLLASLDGVADGISNTPALDETIPGIGKSINELLGDDATLGDLLRFEAAAAEYFASFDQTSELFDPVNIGQSPTVIGLRDALAQRVSVGQLVGSQGAPVSITGGVDLETNRLVFDVDIDASTTNRIAPDLSGFGDELHSIGLQLDPNFEMDVTTDADVKLSFGIGLSAAEGVDPFFQFEQFEVATSANATGAVGYEMGPLNGSLNLNPLSFNAAVQVGLPTDSVSNVASITDQLSITPSGSFSALLDFQDAIFGAALPSITISETLFDGNLPNVSIDFAALVNGLSAETIINALAELADWIDAAILEGELSNATIPLVNKTLGELTGSEAEPRVFGASEIIRLTEPVVESDAKTFQVTLNTGGRGASMLGIKVGDTMRFKGVDGDFFNATIDSTNGETVIASYPSGRVDTPDVADPELEFLVGGSIGDSIRAALEIYSNPELAAPTIGEFFDQLGQSLGIDINDVQVDPNTKELTFTPSFSPTPTLFETQLDFGDSIPGVDFEASRQRLVASRREHSFADRCTTRFGAESRPTRPSLHCRRR